ncbi:hypothetical protein R50072_12100 [Simiduia litorea]
MSNKPLTDQEKQFTVLPTEADPISAANKAQQAVLKAMSHIKKNCTRKG